MSCSGRRGKKGRMSCAGDRRFQDGREENRVGGVKGW